MRWPYIDKTIRLSEVESMHVDIDIVTAISDPAPDEFSELRFDPKTRQHFTGGVIPPRVEVTATVGRLLRVYMYDSLFGSGVATYYFVAGNGEALELGTEILELDLGGGSPRVDTEDHRAFRLHDTPARLRRGLHPLQAEVKDEIVTNAQYVEMTVTVSWMIYAAYTRSAIRNERRVEHDCTVVFGFPRVGICTIITSAGEVLRKREGSFEMTFERQT